MKNKNENWLDFICKCGIEEADDILTGQLLEVMISEDSTGWNISIQLDSLLPLKRINELKTKIEKFIFQIAKIKRIRINWSYVHKIDDLVLISEYFEAAVKASEANRKIAGVLREYEHNINLDQIQVNVASKTDQSIAGEALRIVREFFFAYGLKDIQLNAVVCDGANCLIEKFEEEQKLKSQERDVRSYEQQKRVAYEMRSTEGQASFKSRRSRNIAKIEISELPVTNMQATEFNQKNNMSKVTIEGVIFTSSTRRAGKYNIFECIVTDYIDSITVKRFFNESERNFFEKEMKPGSRVSITGDVQYDSFSRDVVIMASQIDKLGEDTMHMRFDESPKKRVELHAHTKMSTLDGVMDYDKYIDTAVRFGHQALAVTDRANCHILPKFFEYAKKAKIKPIAGIEGNFIDDSQYKITSSDDDFVLHDATFVVFDIETTGFSVNYHDIIEIGALKIKNGMQIDSFSSFVRPSKKISKFISDFTNISNEDVAHAPSIDEVLPKFIAFIKDSILVAHNASFDTAHIYYQMKRLGLYQNDYPTIDTLQLARVLYHEKIKRFNLEAVAKELKVELVDHHRAISDARTTTNIFMKMLGDLSDLMIDNYRDINSIIDQKTIFKFVIPRHINILVKNKAGLKNFYHLISESNTTYFYKEPRLLKSLIASHRKGLLIGSSCANGEIFSTAFEKSYEELREKALFYDFLEVQPPDTYEHLVSKNDDAEMNDYIKKTIERIIQVGKELNIPVVATGNVHQLEESDTDYRKIFIHYPRPGGGRHELAGMENIPATFFRTTNQMLEAFSFLPIDVAHEIVITNPNLIADQIEQFDLFPRKLFTPKDDYMKQYGTPSMADAVQRITFERAYELYGIKSQIEDDKLILPSFIQKRLESELDSIIGNKFASIYYISHMLVKKSVENGYIVGSRGSVGSSLVATMMEITEVNPLKPHYVCPKCHYSAFKEENGDNQARVEQLSPEIQKLLLSVSSGQDLPSCSCPDCGTGLNKEGVDIPFETFLGIKGSDSKVPDIDLNFSGEYQEQAHLFCREIFGYNHSFRGGTISTVKDKTAFGYVKNYLEDKGRIVRDAEIKRLSNALIGGKRTTGQHPGGIVIIPDSMEFTDLIPIQYPSDDPTSAWRTVHYEYHDFEKHLLKLDILGHDDPTMIRYLMDFVEKYPHEFPFKTVEDIPILDEKVMSLFSSKEALGIRNSEEDPFPSGTIGIPEFGTNFVRDMLKDIQPSKFSDIVKVSGLAHGRNIWAGNFRELVLGIESKYDKVPFDRIIACRDDILIYLIEMKLDPTDAFAITESVRKGYGLTKAQITLMKQHGVPNWYIDACQKIEYMFPKAHAVAYVIMALRIAWFKVYHPLYYYATYFSRRARAFDVEVFTNGKNAIRNKIQEIAQKIGARSATTKENDLFDELQIALEMCLRGFEFKQVNVICSDAKNFVLTDDLKGLYLPFCAVDSLGQIAAESIVEARRERPFNSKEDFRQRSKVTRTVFNRLKVLGVLDELPDEIKIDLFGRK